MLAERKPGKCRIVCSVASASMSTSCCCFVGSTTNTLISVTQLAPLAIVVMRQLLPNRKRTTLNIPLTEMVSPGNDFAVAHETARQILRCVEGKPHGAGGALGNVAVGICAAHVGPDPAGTDRVDRDRPAQFRC